MAEAADEMRESAPPGPPGHTPRRTRHRGVTLAVGVLASVGVVVGTGMVVKFGHDRADGPDRISRAESRVQIYDAVSILYTRKVVPTLDRAIAAEPVLVSDLVIFPWVVFGDGPLGGGPLSDLSTELSLALGAVMRDGLAEPQRQLMDEWNDTILEVVQRHGVVATDGRVTVAPEALVRLRAGDFLTRVRAAEARALADLRHRVEDERSAYGRARWAFWVALVGVVVCASVLMFTATAWNRREAEPGEPAPSPGALSRITDQAEQGGAR